MNSGNNLSQQQKSQISMQRGQDQKINAGIPIVEQHQPHCCLNPQTNYGFCMPQGQGPPQNGAFIQQQHVNQTNPNICAYCHCQCHYQHHTVAPPAFPICYQQTSPQGTSRNYVSTIPSPYHIVAAASSPTMPFNPSIQASGCIPTFTTSYTYPAAAGANQQPNASAYHMYVSTNAINVDDPRAAGMKAIKSIHEDTSDSQGVTSDSSCSSEKLITRPGWKWESVPASSDKQRSQGKIPRDEYKNQNVKKTRSVSSKKYVGSKNADSLGKKDTGSSNKKIDETKENDGSTKVSNNYAKDNGSFVKVSNSYARDGNSYIREGDSYARPTTYTVREDQASIRSAGRRVSISSKPPTEEPVYSAPLNENDEVTDKTENKRLSERTPAKSGSARLSGVQKIKSAVRQSKVESGNKSGSNGKQTERTKEKYIAKTEESYVEDIEETNAIAPVEEIEDIRNQDLAEDFGSSNIEESQDDNAIQENIETLEDIEFLSNIGDQYVEITEANILPEKNRENYDENKDQPNSFGSYAETDANKLRNERNSYEIPKANVNKEPEIEGLPEKDRDKESENKSRPKSLGNHTRRNASSDRGRYEMPLSNVYKEPEIEGLPGKDKDSENKSQPKSRVNHSRRNASSDRGRYEIPMANVNKESEIDKAKGLPEKGRDNDSDNKSQPKSLGNHSRRNASSDRGSYEISITNINKLHPGITQVNGHPEKDNDTENTSQPKSLGTNSGRDANKSNNERGSYEIPEVKLNKEPGVTVVNGIPEKGRDNNTEKKSPPKSFGNHSGRGSNKVNNGRGRVSNEKRKSNFNKEPGIIKANDIPEKVRDTDTGEKNQQKLFRTNSGRDANKLKNNERVSYETPEINLNKNPEIAVLNGIPEKESQQKLLGTNSERNATKLSDEHGRGSYEMPKSNSNSGPSVSRKSIQPNRAVSEVERAAATQISGIPLPTKTIPVESPKTGATWKPNVARRSVDQQSQTGKFPRKKTLEMLSQLSLESFEKIISSFVGISLYDKDERVANLINAILESAEPEMEGSSALRNTLYIPPEVFRDDENISEDRPSSKYRLPGGYQHRKNEGTGTASLQNPDNMNDLSHAKIYTGPISASARKASVNNIIQEFSNNKKFDDTLSNIKKTFPGEKIDDFVENLSKHAEKMTDDKEIENAGRLVRLLIGNRDISKKEAIKVISSALIDLPQNLIDSPMAAISTAQYLVEIFSEESNFDWLFQIGMKLTQSDDERTSAAWRDLSINTLKMLKSKTNEK